MKAKAYDKDFEERMGLIGFDFQLHSTVFGRKLIIDQELACFGGYFGLS